MGLSLSIRFQSLGPPPRRGDPSGGCGWSSCAQLRLMPNLMRWISSPIHGGGGTGRSALVTHPPHIASRIIRKSKNKIPKSALFEPEFEFDVEGVDAVVVGAVIAGVTSPALISPKV
jgi:hypothetical protein